MHVVSADTTLRPASEGGREGGREGGKEEGREEGKEKGRKRGREGKCTHLTVLSSVMYVPPMVGSETRAKKAI